MNTGKMDTFINSDGVHFTTIILLMITPGGLANVVDWVRRSPNFRKRAGGAAARRLPLLPTFR